MTHYYHFAVRRWVFWTFIAGVTIGVYVLANLASWEHMTPIHLQIALVVGAMFWLLFALVAWTADGIELSHREISVGRALPIEPTHALWEDRARLEAIRARAAEHTGESHFAS
jgi:uncharacterized membrane protein YdcZ (DUF606 family)